MYREQRLTFIHDRATLYVLLAVPLHMVIPTQTTTHVLLCSPSDLRVPLAYHLGLEYYIYDQLIPYTY